jgi:hypothetical protein
MDVDDYENWRRRTRDMTQFFADDIVRICKSVLNTSMGSGMVSMMDLVTLLQHQFLITLLDEIDIHKDQDRSINAVIECLVGFHLYPIPMADRKTSDEFS